MKEPLTEELLQELLDSPSPMEFVEKHKVGKRTLSAYLQQLLEEKGLSRADVIRAAGLNETYGYEIFMGRKHPKRNYVLQIVFAMGLTRREANRVLQAAKVNDLYCKDRRDAIILFCLENGYSLQKTDEELYRFKEDTIC